MSRDTRNFVVLDVSGTVTQLQLLMEFVVDNNVGTGLKRLNKTATFELVHKIVIQGVNWRMAHNPYGCYEKAILECLFGERDKEYSKKEKQLYTALTNDPQWLAIVDYIEKQISEHIKVDTYKDWRVIKVGNLLGLAEGEDYRITEYYRLCPEQKENEEAVITLNASNPLNYLLAQFNHIFGLRLEQLANERFFNSELVFSKNEQLINHKDLFTQERLRTMQRHSRDKLVSDPVAVQQHLSWINDNRLEYVISMFFDVLKTIYPMIELDINVPRFNSAGLAYLSLWNSERYREEYVQRVISAFGFSYFSTYLKKNKKYKLEFYPQTCIFAVYEVTSNTPGEVDDMECLQSYINGDRLPPEQARRAQELYEEMARRGEIQ